jgi:hypothetical protein
MPIVSDSCTSDSVVWKSLTIVGSDGRYISVNNGPNADRMPRKSIKNAKYGFENFGV